MAVPLGSRGKTAQFWTMLGLVFCIFITSVRAQAPNGAISGTIITKSGSRVPNASISANNIASGETKSVIANQDGSFLLDDLSPTTYEVMSPLLDLPNGKPP